MADKTERFNKTNSCPFLQDHYLVGWYLMSVSVTDKLFVLNIRLPRLCEDHF